MSLPNRPRTLRAAGRLSRGFTLIELMITLAVVAIIAAAAYPSYSSHVAKGRRTDGKQALMEVAQLLERHYAERGTYVGATLGASGLYPASSRAGHYTLALSGLSADGYTLTATPTGAQAGDRCGNLRLDQTGTVSVTGAGATVSSCW